MNTKTVTLAEKTIVLLLVLSFTLPMALSAWLRLSNTHSVSTAWLRNEMLAGTRYAAEPVDLSAAGVLSGKTQNAAARNYDNMFSGREVLIRIFDELYWRAFHASPSALVIGPDDTLYELAYVREYYLERKTGEMFVSLVRDLRRFQDFCTARGIAFMLLITPSKAAVYPERMPEAWQRRYNPGSRGYELLLPLLKEAGVRYVDGHQVMMDWKPKARLPLFPPGGTHWNSEAAFVTSNALLSMLASQGLPVKPVTDYTVTESYCPRAIQDRDLADFLNKLVPLNYPVPEVDLKAVPIKDRYRSNLVIVGGSFIWRMLTMLGASRQFSEQDYHYYYTLSKHCQVEGEPHTIAEPAEPVNFDTDIFAADAVVLEINEQAIHLPNHVSLFLHDALAVLPDPHSPKAPFHYESQQSYEWGDTLSFVPGKNLVKSITGFTMPGPAGAYTDGPVASLHLTAPPPTEDMKLELTASAFIAAPKLPEQNVDVLVNDHPVGHWVWTNGASAKRELTIPKDFLNGGRVRLDFHLPNAVAPTDLGVFVEVRKLGICVTSIRLYPASDTSPDQPPPVYQWGDTLSFVEGKSPIDPGATRGFTAPGPAGAFTDGPVASVRFRAAPAGGDMKLEVSAAPFLSGERLPRQDVNVFINDQPVGAWTWKEGDPVKRELVVPKEVLTGGRVRLEFRIPHATSPAELGVSPDRRKFGICVSSIRLSPAAK